MFKELKNDQTHVMTYKPKTKEWFRSMIGKKVYRDDHKCCAICERVFNNGMIVADRQHADYLAEIDSVFANEGIYLNYRDEK
jgi:hypothetical protein